MLTKKEENRWTNKWSDVSYDLLMTLYFREFTIFLIFPTWFGHIPTLTPGKFAWKLSARENLMFHSNVTSMWPTKTWSCVVFIWASLDVLVEYMLHKLKYIDGFSTNLSSMYIKTDIACMHALEHSVNWQFVKIVGRCHFIAKGWSSQIWKEQAL